MTAIVDHADSGWMVQLSRLTVFLSSPVSTEIAENIWQLSTGEIPEINENRPREGVRRQSGTLVDTQLEVSVWPSRVDWVITPLIIPGEAHPVFFAPFEDGFQKFQTSAIKWLDIGVGPYTRIAIGAAFLLPASDVKSSYLQLKSKLKSVRVDPDHSSDFFYQINWPRLSNAYPGLKVNRLTRWNSLSVQSVNFEVPRLTKVAEGGVEYFSRLECDYSTDVARTESLEPSKVPPLFEELCSLIKENVQKGEMAEGYDE